jgi:hypothetical protein
MKIFISPPDATDHALLEPSMFESAFRERWPNAKLEYPTKPSDAHALDWEIAMRYGLVVGSFGKDGVTIVCDGDVRDCGEIAL